MKSITISHFMILCLVFLGYARLSEAREVKQPNTIIKRPDLVVKLLKTESRDQALDELIKLNKYSEADEPTPCKVNHIVICPQEDGSRLYAVFKSERYEKRYGGGSGKPLCHVIIFDRDGKLHPYYSNANFITGVFSDVNGDGIVENIESWGIGGDSCPDHSGVRVLHIIPIITNPIPLLCVAYDPDNRKTERWSWRALDDDMDGVLEIQLGPVVSIHGEPGMNLHDDGRNKDIKPLVTYRWSKERKSYIGPDGGNDKPYRRIDPLNIERDLKSFNRVQER